MEVESTPLHYNLQDAEQHTLAPALDWFEINDEHGTLPELALDIQDQERTRSQEFGAAHRAHVMAFLVSVRAAHDPMWFGDKQMQSREVRDYVTYKRSAMVAHFVSELTRINEDIRRAYARVQRERDYDLSRVRDWDPVKAIECVARVRTTMREYFSLDNRALLDALMQPDPRFPDVPKPLAVAMIEFGRMVRHVTDIEEMTMARQMTNIWRDSIKSVAYSANKSYEVRGPDGTVQADMRQQLHRDLWYGIFKKGEQRRWDGSSVGQQLMRGDWRMELHKFVCNRVHKTLLALERHKIERNNVVQFPTAWFREVHMAARLTQEFHADILDLTDAP